MPNKNDLLHIATLDWRNSESDFTKLYCSVMEWVTERFAAQGIDISNLTCEEDLRKETLRLLERHRKRYENSEPKQSQDHHIVVYVAVGLKAYVSRLLADR